MADLIKDVCPNAPSTIPVVRGVCLLRLLHNGTESRGGERDLFMRCLCLVVGSRVYRSLLVNIRDGRLFVYNMCILVPASCIDPHKCSAVRVSLIRIHRLVLYQLFR
jgi:hypothetical protein